MTYYGSRMPKMRIGQVSNAECILPSNTNAAYNAE